VLLDSKVRVQNIVLRAYAKVLADVLHLSLNILAAHEGLSAGGINKTGEHGNGGSFTGSVVPKKAGDLVVKHVEI
jgi:hypothetical protein